jgi:anti-sigma regulatory factor (Ser/Thr protein kinase)
MTGRRVLDTVAVPGELGNVTRFVRESCGAPAGADFARLDLIVEELFLNISMHACPGEPVRVVCGLVEAGLAELEFLYGGPYFDPTTDAPEPDLDASLAERPIGGLGLFLVREMAEALDFDCDEGVNRLTARVRVG